ncbi:hypothetical protein D3C71_1573110 [compost metagenome]
MAIFDEGEEDANSEIEAIHDDIHHDPEGDDDSPDEGKIDTHVKPPLFRATARGQFYRERRRADEQDA